jgi:hypothetical protein
VRCPLRAALVILAILRPGVLSAEAIERLSKTVHLAPGTAVRVEATVAELTIVGSDRMDLVVEIVRRAPSPGDLAKYPALVDEQPDALTIAAVQMGEGRDPALKTDITISAPAATVFQAVRVFEGRVKITNLTSVIDVDLRRGAIEAAGLAGRVRLEVGIGSIDLHRAVLTPGGMVRLRVFNGPLRLRFARAPSSARILALTLQDQFGPRFGETTIGAGDPVVSLDVVKGDISIGVNDRP